MKKTIVLLSVIFSLFLLINCNNTETHIAESELYKGFLKPPHEAKPTVYFTLLNGYMNKKFIKQELKEYADKGIGGLLVFDIGILGKKECFPPQGAEFMSNTWLDNFKYIVETADELGMSVELAGVSSWDMGGSWTPPEEAVLSLFQKSFTVNGPKQLKKLLEYPELPKTAILDSSGNPVVSEEIAVLAIPVKKRQRAFEFIYKLDSKPLLHNLDYVILANTDKTNSEIAGGSKIYTKDFAVDVSITDEFNDSFSCAFKGSLKADTSKQLFKLPEGTKAKYVRLRILNGHNTTTDYVQLSEFHVFNTNGQDIIERPYNNRFGGGMEIRFNSQFGSQKKWRAKNLNIKSSERTGNVGESWISNGKPPLVIDNLNDIQIITSKVDNGVLTWEVPDGEWEIIRYVMTNTGERLKIPNPASDGYATDHLSEKATINHINYMTKRLENKFGDLAKSSIKNFYLPSYEVVGMLWTYDFAEKFQKYRNYDVIKFLPALNGTVIINNETTDRFLYDYQKTMGELLVDAFYATANKTAHERGMAIKSESAGPGPPIHNVPVEALKSLNSIDEMQGEFWPWREHWDGLWVVKEVASASHIYGEDKLVHMESFTGFRHWMDGPVDLKPSADRAFCEGMNHIVWHMAEHNPPEAGIPGWAYHAGTHFSVNLAWWNQMKPWIDYLARTSYMLQQGKFVADVLYYYGDKGANFIQPKYTNSSLNDGYDYDVTNLEVMLTRLDVNDGDIVLPDGLSYKILVLPQQKYISVAAIDKIKELVEKGATVIGQRPERSPGYFRARENDTHIKNIAEELWGAIDGESITEHKFGLGRVIYGRDINTVLKDMGVSFDFSYSGLGVELDYIHRRTINEDIYFIRNKKDQKASFTAHFRVKNATPEMWLPDTGGKLPLLVNTQTDSGTKLELELDKYGSVFVVFKKGVSKNIKSISKGAKINAVSNSGIIAEVFKNGDLEIVDSNNKKISTQVSNVPQSDIIKGEWTMEFLQENFGAPQSVSSSLKSLTDFDEKGIKYYSGEVKYTKNFTISDISIADDNKVYLDLGSLWLTADVTVNNTFVGNLWKSPYVIDITKFVKSGNNTMEIIVANTWGNRLIGDAKNPHDTPYCRTNIDGTETTEAVPFAESEPRKSGLFGPVKLIYSVQVEMKNGKDQ